MNIPNRYTHETIWEGTIEAFRDAIAYGALNLSNADLRGVDLSEANLRGVNLSFVDLRGAHLSGADLRGVDLIGADLRSAYLIGAYLSGADLRSAHLSGADLLGADLSGAYLSGVDLIGAHLSRANLSGTNLRGADLIGAHLSGAYLNGCFIRTIMGIGPVGSRGDCLTIWFMEDGTRLYSTGCQNQISEELLLERNAARVSGEETYAAQYVAAVEFARVMSKIAKEAEK